MKTPKNIWFSGVFRAYKMERLARNRLNKRREANQGFKSRPISVRSVCYVETTIAFL